MTILEKLIASLKSVENIDKLTTIEGPEAKQNVNLVVGRYNDDCFILTGYGLDDNTAQNRELSEFKEVEAEEFIKITSEIIKSELGVDLESCNVNLYIYELLLVGELKPILNDPDVNVNYPYLIDGSCVQINHSAATSFYVTKELEDIGLSQIDLNLLSLAITTQIDPVIDADKIKNMIREEAAQHLDEMLKDSGGFAKILEKAEEKARKLEITGLEYRGERYDIVLTEIFDEVGHYQQGLEIYSINVFGNRFIQIGSFYKGQPT